MPGSPETPYLIVANPTQILRLIRRRLCSANSLFGIHGRPLEFAEDLDNILLEARKAISIWHENEATNARTATRDDEVLPK